MKKTALFLVFVGVSFAADLPRWAVPVSQMTLAAGTAADLATSTRAYETNPLYRSASRRCEAKCFVLRAGLTTGVILAQRFVLNRTDNKKVRRLFVIVNGAASSSSFAVAAHNSKVERR